MIVVQFAHPTAPHAAGALPGPRPPACAPCACLPTCRLDRDVEGAAEVVLPSGVRYTDLRVGGGQVPPKGYLVVVDYV